MTTREFLLIILYRWYVVLLGLAATAASAVAVWDTSPTVYWARSTVTVLQREPNPLTADALSINGVAVILVARANGTTTPEKLASPEATMYGEGIYDGSRVQLRDTGGQWTTRIADPVLYLEAVGPTPDVVTARIDTLAKQVSADLLGLQRQLGVSTDGRMFLRIDPEPPEVSKITGNRTRVFAAVALIGLVGTSVALFAIDRVWPRRSAAMRAVPEPLSEEEDQE